MAEEFELEADANVAASAEEAASEVTPEEVAAEAAGQAEEAPVYTPELVETLIEGLSGASRRRRQEVGFEIAAIAHVSPELLEPHINALIDALYRPEAQTRWEVLDALTVLAELYGERTFGAFDGAETALFDEDSATVRLAAFLFLTRYASVSPELSDEAWPLLDEAIQCYHGDAEYHDMLAGLLEMVQGNVSEATAKALVDRVGFDAENSASFIKTYSAQIIKAVKDGASAGEVA